MTPAYKRMLERETKDLLNKGLSQIEIDRLLENIPASTQRRMLRQEIRNLVSKGLTQVEVARMLDLTKQAVYEYNKPTAEELDKE